MTKTIRKTYPRDFSIGVLIIIFTCVFFLAGQLFEKHQPNLSDYLNMYVAYFLVSLAVLVMILILWEEILFPVTIKPEGDGLIFRNHRTKLKIQALFFLSIPAIIVFLFLNYEINTFRFFGWAAVNTGLPILGKLISGINNYNDFLTLTSSYIEYKNNELEGKFEVCDIQSIHINKDDKGLHQKLVLEFKSSESVTIDMDEMELEDFYESIDEYIAEHYKSLLK
ncbi:MAG: heavy metal transporter [Flammeovirgaceae bacterium]|nr:heavy metal transporter [Flammeovirgaceae bacterium]MBE60895.1 heavy metal transporter [Flammeovirgaceae bacterium]HCX24888.1 heavy metal transporter [Cytophagales bacterium]|tara:strand:- start:3795 stop:4466 length:672 start_codon:yes stop_codon:yes gene_type:complete